MSQENVKIIGEMYQAATRGETEKVLSALDSGVVVYEQESLPYGGVYKGYDGFQKLFQNLAAHWDDFNFDVKELLHRSARFRAVTETPKRHFHIERLADGEHAAALARKFA